MLSSSICSYFCSETLSPPVPTLAGRETGAGLASYRRKEGWLQTIVPQASASQLAKKRVSQPLPGNSGDIWPLPPASALLRQAPVICGNLRWGVKIETTYVPTLGTDKGVSWLSWACDGAYQGDRPGVWDRAVTYPILLGSLSCFPQLMLASTLSSTALGLPSLQGPPRSPLPWGSLQGAWLSAQARGR